MSENARPTILPFSSAENGQPPHRPLREDKLALGFVQLTIRVWGSRVEIILELAPAAKAAA